MKSMKRKFAVVIATALTLASISSLTGSSEVNTLSHSYRVYDYATESVLTNSAYTLNLSRYNANAARTIIGEDSQRPYQNSGVVKLNMNSLGLGTGFIVGDHTIVTAAHCIYNLTSSSYSQNMRVSLYDDEGDFVKELNKNNTTIQAHIPSLYITASGNNYKYDYAMITVSEDLSDYEHFELGEVLEPAADYAVPVKVCGYSGEVLKIAGGQITEMCDRYFKYNVDTESGDSGGPVFVPTIYSVGNTLYPIKTVVGIDTYSGTGFNQGNLMTPEMRQFYLNNPYNTLEG